MQARKILEDVKGWMLEDIVLLEVSKSLSRSCEVFKFKFDTGGEYNMVIYNKESRSCKLYEIKHSTVIKDRQTIYLRSTEKCGIIEQRFGQIESQYVLYRGENTLAGDVEYRNVDQFLCELS